nr:hypothetical protein [Lutzomyia ayacuchensis]
MNKIILFSAVFLALVFCAEAMPKESANILNAENEPDDTVDIDEGLPDAFEEDYERDGHNPYPCRGDC